MVKFLVFVLSFGVSLSSQAAVKSNTRIKTEDIKEIYINDAAKNLLVVKDSQGRLLKLNVSKEKREEIVAAVEGYEVASTDTVPAPAEKKALKAAPTTNKVATDLKATAKEEPKSPWGVGYLHWDDVNVEKFHDGTGTVSSYNMLSVSYKLDDSWTLAVQPSWNIDYKLETGATEHKMGNTAVKLSRGKFMTLAGLDFHGSGRYYIPTSESSRNNGSNGIFRGDLEIKKALGKIGLKYTFSPRYYLQSDRSLNNFDEYGRLLNEPKAQTGFRMINEIAASYALFEKLELGYALGMDHATKYDDPEVGLDSGSVTSLEMMASVSISALSFVSIDLYMNQSHDISAGKEHKSYAFFNPTETSYGLVAFFPIK